MASSFSLLLLFFSFLTILLLEVPSFIRYDLIFSTVFLIIYLFLEASEKVFGVISQYCIRSEEPLSSLSTPPTHVFVDFKFVCVRFSPAIREDCLPLEPPPVRSTRHVFVLIKEDKKAELLYHSPFFISSFSCFDVLMKSAGITFQKHHRLNLNVMHYASDSMKNSHILNGMRPQRRDNHDWWQKENAQLPHKGGNWPEMSLEMPPLRHFRWPYSVSELFSGEERWATF